MEQVEPRQMLSGTEFGGAGESLAGDNAQTPRSDAGFVAFGSSLDGLQGGAASLLSGGGGLVSYASLPEGELINAPAAPYSLAATVVSPSEINLTWSLGDASDTSVVIERKTGAGVFQTLATLPPGENTFTDTSCWAATSYAYRIKAVNGGGSSGFSSEQTAVTEAIPTGALVGVSDLRAVASSANAVTISFTDQNTADPKRYYLLERSTDGMAYQVIKSLGTAVTWTDVGRTPGATYYYRVRGVSWTYPSSDYSAPAQVTMADRVAGAPIEPSGLQSSSATATSISLTWTNNDSSNPTFKIERGTYNPYRASTWVTVATTSAGATSFTDVGLKPESTYLYRVSAVNSHGSSGFAVPSSDVMQSLFGDSVAGITSSAGTGSPKVYDIGLGLAYEKIADLDWSKLGPGDTVNIHYKAGGYHELFMISTRGTAENWITINGVPDPATGELPIIDGLEAVLAPQFKSSYLPLHGSGAIIVGTRPGYADGYKAGYVTIQNLQIQRCYAGNNPNTFTDYNGATKAYTTVGAGIYLYRADHVTIRNCVVTDNGEGIFGAGTSSFDRLMSDITISSNHIFKNGNIGSNKQHNTYLEAVDIVYEYNQYGPMRDGAGGNGLKDRSVGVVIRNNYIEGGAHELQLPGAENQDALAVTIPRYHRALVYGNTIVDGPTNVSGPVEYGGEVLSAYDRKGILYLYGNTIAVRADKSVTWRVNAVNIHTTEETLDIRNNIFTVNSATTGALHPDFGLLGMESYTLRKANAYFGRNWVPHDYMLNGYGNAGFKGHVAGLENLLVGKGDNPGFVNLAAGDYRLSIGSQAADQAARLAGTSLAFPLDRQYLAPHQSTARYTIGAAADLGAFELGTYPPLTNPGNQHSTAGDYIRLAIAAIGANAFSAAGLPPGLSIDNNGQISGTIEFLACGNYEVSITASDSVGSSQVTFTWAVDPHPSLVPQPPTDIDLSSMIVADRIPGAVIGFVTVADPNVDDSHTLTVADARFEIVDRQLRLKAGLSLIQETEPTVAIAITATDRFGLSLTQTFMITVTKTAIIDDGDVGYSETGTGWYTTTTWIKGYQNDVRYVSPGDGQKTATWAQTLAPGTYTIQASWAGYHNNVSDAPFRIYDGDRLVSEARFDQKRTPSYALSDPAAFMTLATVDISNGNLRVVLGNDASGGIMVVADAVRIIPGIPAAIPDVIAGPSVADDGDAGYSESAYGWYSRSWWTSGYLIDSRFADVGDGQSTATWAESVAPGQYTIQASWSAYHNNASDAPYRIYDGDSLVALVRVDQQRNPTRAPGESVGFMTLATVEITSGTLRVVLGNDATGGSQVVADAVRVVPGTIVTQPVAVPGPAVVDDGEAGYSESPYGWFSRSWWTSGYKVDSRFADVGDGQNTATWTETVAPGRYTVQASWSGYHNNASDAPYRIYDGDQLLALVRVDQQRNPTRAPGESVGFLTLATVDISSGTLRVVLGNDATGGLQVVADAVRVLAGEVVSPPSEVAGPAIVDDGDAGYTESAYGWYSIGQGTNGYQSDSRFAAAGDGRSTATWAELLAPGTYHIQASWFGSANNVSNAHYRIYDGGTLVLDARVDQKVTPTLTSGDPAPFATLGTVDILSGVVRVVLSNDATGGLLVEADAVRVVPSNVGEVVYVAASTLSFTALDTSQITPTTEAQLRAYENACDEVFGGGESVRDFKSFHPGEILRKSHWLDSKFVGELESMRNRLGEWDETELSLPALLDMFRVLIVDNGRWGELPSKGRGNGDH